MQHHFEYCLTRDEYVVGLTALTNQLGAEDRQRTRRLFEQLGLFIVVLAAITFLFPEALVGMLVAALLLGMLQGLFRGRWIRGATGTSFDPATADHDVEISADGLVERSALRERRWTWAAVRRIHDVPHACVVEFAGWDMLVLPDRLWADAARRRAFLDDVRELATAALPTQSPETLAPFDAPETVTLGAIGAAVDVLGLILFTLPMDVLPSPSENRTDFLVAYIAVLLVGLALAYAAYRLVRRGLAHLMRRSPRAAMLAAQAFIWPVPLYMLAAFFGWI